MSRVSLILPLAPDHTLDPEYVAGCRSALEGAGYAVDVLAVDDPDAPRPVDPHGRPWRRVVARGRGLTSAALTGLVEAGAGSDVVVVLDPRRGYRAEDLGRLVEPLARGEADLALAGRASRSEGQPASPERGPIRRRLADRAVASLARPVLGVSDVSAGLVALSTDLARTVPGTFQPVGSRFALDLLARTGGRRVEVPVRADSPSPPGGSILEDLRFLKRLADDRFGNVSRLIQFCAVGASGMVVDLTCYAAFQLVFSRTRLAGLTTPGVGGPLDLAVAGALAIAVALTWNFSLNRRLTFSYARRGSVPRQFLAYALSNALGIALSFSLRLTLPAHVAFFQRHKLAAAVVGIVTATGISFSMARWVVFSRRSVDRDLARAEAKAAASAS